MSIFNELLPKLFEISKTSTKNFNDELQSALSCLDLFEEEYQNGRRTARERAQRDKTLMTTLQSINEDDDESNKNPKQQEAIPTDKPAAANDKRRVSKKRSKDEVDGMSSPEQDKRTKRNASVKAQSIISKQDKTRQILKDLNENGVAFVSTEKVNVNLNQKMRREGSTEKRSRRRNEDDKENSEPSVPPIHIKQEKISLPPEPMDTDALVPVNVKQEPKDSSSMPPPAAPVPKPRKGLQKEKQREKESEEPEESEGRRRRTTRTRKQTDTAPPAPAPVPPAPATASAPPPVASARPTRGSSRATKPADSDKCEEEMPPPPAPEPRPKRTRAKKNTSESSNTDTEKNTAQTDESVPSSPADKPRPKRTRRGKNAEKEAQKTEEPPQKDQENTAKEQTKTRKDQTLTKDQTGSQESIQLKEERISHPGSPLLQKPKKDNKKNAKADKSRANKTHKVVDDTSQLSQDSQFHTPPQSQITIEDTITKSNLNVTVTLNGDMDKTVVLPNGVYNHAPHTPKANNILAASNATVVLEKDCRTTMFLETQHINDATVVLDKDPKAANITDDNSLLTSDGSEAEVPTTPPKGKDVAAAQPTSAVKEKVQQFEELAARTTRTKTRAMAKMEEPENNTPPDKTIKPVLSQETLNKMNNMIFNGKPPQVTTSASASKPRALPPKPAPAPASASASKVSALHRYREEKEREDARKKKEALLEAKREMHKKKREEKMANAAAAREAAERERRLAMEAAAKERNQKQMHADQGKLERLKEVERKKQELARKVAETEERRRAEEQARQQRLAEEQKKAELARKKQLEEAEAMKKEAALMAKEIEKRQKEYLEKQKMKLISEKSHTPLKHMGTPGLYPQEPVYMADGFQYLNSDEDEEPPPAPVPSWSTSKARKQTLMYQSQISSHHIDTLFSVKAHTPDLREIFPLIERARLKRTSSAVWRTPPPPPAAVPRAQ